MLEIALAAPEFDELAKDILRKGGSFRFRAHGASMTPCLKNNDVVIVSPNGLDSLRAGDIALYERDNGLCIHRVVEVNGGDSAPQLLLSADWYDGPLEQVEVSRVIGRVVGIEKAYGTLRVDSPWFRMVGFVARGRRVLLRAVSRL